MNYDLSGVSVLIVDDYPPMRSILKEVLRALGIRAIREANDGEQAIAKLQEEEPDLVLADYLMQPVDGVSLTNQIRSGEAGVDPFLPVIMVSGLTEMTQIMKARDAGITEFLAKPIAAKLLYYRIKAVIENPRAFVRTGEFFGPDRRRRAMETDIIDRRGEEHQYPGKNRGGGR